MKKKILGAVLIIILGGLVYLGLRSSSPSPKQPEGQTNQEATTEKQEIKEEKKPKIWKLFYRHNLISEKSPHPGKQVVELKIAQFNQGDGSIKENLVFTDLDEDFQIRLVGGLFKDFALVFGTPLNEVSGSIWQINLDDSGSKKQLIDRFSASSFASNGEKIAFIAYDNINGLYALWLSNIDGRFKTKVLESETALGDPLILTQSLAFVKIDKEGNGAIMTVSFDGKNQKEIKKAQGQLIYNLSASSNKFAYIKTPKAGGAENLAEVYLCDLNGQNEKRITNDKEADAYPVLSKDGSFMAFYKGGKIWLGNSDGTSLKAIGKGSQSIGFME